MTQADQAFRRIKEVAREREIQMTAVYIKAGVSRSTVFRARKRDRVEVVLRLFEAVVDLDAAAKTSSKLPLDKSQVEALRRHALGKKTIHQAPEAA